MPPITSTTQLCALIGDPVEHSLSPIMHNAAFRYLGMDYVYACLRVESRELGKAVEGIKSLGIKGLNVTIPHKIAVINHLDEVEPQARDIGAVNTIINRNGYLIGGNTDGSGALRALRKAKVRIEGMKILILGAGGASRALSFTLCPLAKSLVILNRTEERAQELATSLKKRVGGSVLGLKLDRQNLSRELRGVDMLINTTPVGMRPIEGESLVNRNLISPDMTVFDIVYNPLETRLLHEAEEAGATTVNGLSMLVNQGALSFQKWTGVTPPTDIMLKAVEEVLKSS